MAEPFVGAAGQERYFSPPVKRLLDLVIAGVALIPALPVMFIAAVLIRATSRGPVLFVQQRLGCNEVPFRCYKLRTMYRDTPSVPTHEARPDVITPVGRFLRAAKLDELPQLWNVLKGEMSLVGPRPCLPGQDELVRYRRGYGVFRARPGITGLAQLRGIDMSQPKLCAETDAEYLHRWSIGLDLSLLVRTVLRSSP